MRNRWLIDGEGTCYFNDANSETRHLDTSIVYSTMAWLRAKMSPHALVFAGHQTIRFLYFDGRGLKMQDLKKFVAETLDIAEAMLSEHLLFQRDGSLPEFDLSSIDDPSNHEAGYYFVHKDQEGWNVRAIRVRVINM